jgi:hypothetical protein
MKERSPPPPTTPVFSQARANNCRREVDGEEGDEVVAARALPVGEGVYVGEQ